MSPLDDAKGKAVAQILLVAAVVFAWVAMLFLPLTAQVQAGIQGAMMMVLGAYFGVQIFRKGGDK